MTDDLVRELQQFQQHMEKLQKLMSDMNDQMPREAQGEDPQGAATVRTGPDGLPESIKVASDWQRRRRPEELGQAVMEAYTAAMNERMERWSRSFSGSGWEARAQELDGTPGQFPPVTNAPLPPAPEHDTRHVVARPIDEVTEDILSALDTAQELDAGAFRPPEAKGDSAAHQVVITLNSQTLVSCEVDPQWAAQQSGVRLGQALGEALNHAREAVTQAESAAQPGVANVHMRGLLDETMAILKDPQRFSR